MKFLSAASTFVAATAIATFPASVLADRLDDMISPMSHPTTFEDPRNTTELRPIYLYHKIDDKFVTGGGDVQIYALQARFALSEDLSIIATKDGYVDINPDGVVPSDEGFANISAGIKAALYRSDDSILSAGLRYEAAVGEKEVLQGEGDGTINPFLSGAVALGDINVMAGTGLRLAVDDELSSFWDLDVNVSYRCGSFYPFVEFGLIQVIDDGELLPIADEGQDFFNLGASDSDGETILTASAGARYRISDDIDVGAVYQFPLDRSKGSRILDYRIVADMIFRFTI